MVSQHKRTSSSLWLVGGAARRKREAHVMVAYRPKRICAGQESEEEGRREVVPRQGAGRCGGSPKRTSTSATRMPLFPRGRMLRFSTTSDDDDDFGRRRRRRRWARRCGSWLSGSAGISVSSRTRQLLSQSQGAIAIAGAVAVAGARHAVQRADSQTGWN